MLSGMNSTSDAAERDSAGFRRRGFEVTRLMAFVDAAFAFALTLLVISFDHIPGNVPELVAALKGIPAFAASFALLAQLWWTHSRYTWRFGLEDGPTTVYSLLLVFLVLVYVYPLKLLFATAFGWISDGWLPAGFAITGVDDLRLMFMIYGVALSLLGITLIALYRHAWSQREALALDPGERVQLRVQLISYGFMPVLGLLSALLAWLIPERPQAWMLALPGCVYFLNFLQWPVLAWAARHLRVRLSAS